MNVGYGYSITELETKLLDQLKSNRLFMIFLYIILFYIMISTNVIIFMIYYYLP